VPTILLATDADWIHEDVDAALAGDDIEVLRLHQGVDVLPTVHELAPDLVVLDLPLATLVRRTAWRTSSSEASGRA
jgi:DNA-binding response OmpR family regulator